uniref:Glycosyl hydrolase family 13 catalytic domain-containing protein n=1 Tax=Biomphalaria glabrata TaxID=6526 RepID=A0A2C9KXC9_BIOGL
MGNSSVPTTPTKITRKRTLSSSSDDPNEETQPEGPNEDFRSGEERGEEEEGEIGESFSDSPTKLVTDEGEDPNPHIKFAHFNEGLTYFDTIVTLVAPSLLVLLFMVCIFSSLVAAYRRNRRMRKLDSTFVSCSNVEDQDDYLDHIYTQHQPEIAPILKGWYDLLHEYTLQDGRLRYMVLETYAPHSIRNSLYAQGQGNPFNFDLLQMSRPPTTREVYKTIMEEYTNLLPGKWPNFVLGNHDNTRVSARNGYQYVDAYNMLLLTLKGTPTTYYGEELGMLQADISWNETKDPWGLNYGPDRYKQVSRDPERTPMQWTDGPNAGFTNGPSTWLPLGKNYTSLNVKVESETPGQTSLKLYKELLVLRKNPAFTEGSFKTALVTDDVLSYLRQLRNDTLLVVLNFGNEATVDLSSFGGLSGTALALTPSTLELLPILVLKVFFMFQEII